MDKVWKKRWIKPGIESEEAFQDSLSTVCNRVFGFWLGGAGWDSDDMGHPSHQIVAITHISKPRRVRCLRERRAY
jgi:hypothetical protein